MIQPAHVDQQLARGELLPTHRVSASGDRKPPPGLRGGADFLPQGIERFGPHDAVNRRLVEPGMDVIDERGYKVSAYYLQTTLQVLSGSRLAPTSRCGHTATFGVECRYRLGPRVVGCREFCVSSRWPITNVDQVRAYTQLADAACPRCRYPLHGLPEAKCPECGTPLTVLELSRPRWSARVWVSMFGDDTGPRNLRWLAALNVLLALAIVASSLANHGRLPILSWLAPGVLGAFAFSVQYVAVFARYCPVRHDPMEGWGSGMAAAALIVQMAGLILMWV